MKRIAIIKGSSLGDILTGIPMMKSIKKKWPDSKISLIHNYVGSGESLIKKSKYIDEDILVSPDLNGIRKIISLRNRFDIIIDGFPNTKFSSLFSFLSGAPIRASYDNPPNKFSFMYNVKTELKGDVVELEGNILRKIGIEPTDEMEVEMKPFNMKKRDNLIGINVGKEDNFCRTWVNEKWVELIKELLKKNATVVFLGAKDNEEKAGPIKKMLDNKKNIIDLIGKTDIEELAYVVNKCDLLISVNGGAMHIAAALKKKQIVLNGPSLPQWNPHNKKAICLGGRKFCNTKCNDNYCFYGDARCIKNITVEEVMKEVDKEL